MQWITILDFAFPPSFLIEKKGTDLARSSSSATRFSEMNGSRAYCRAKWIALQVVKTEELMTQLSAAR